jgi:hypothetical protein
MERTSRCRRNPKKISSILNIDKFNMHEAIFFRTRLSILHRSGFVCRDATYVVLILDLFRKR